ncbi:hypothetical protein ARMGADRAFT_1015535 [Armillaria gallica]|uniref:Uncharacterized protein n=1 Tax=Armillaria gallica TaxID=47427 RepID=A0A2H3D2A4_ARMGA|nr:hypothetical protein ARMGADRAFT_1015535 [Armillaria gallica]
MAQWIRTTKLKHEPAVFSILRDATSSAHKYYLSAEHLGDEGRRTNSSTIKTTVPIDIRISQPTMKHLLIAHGSSVPPVSAWVD